MKKMILIAMLCIAGVSFGQNKEQITFSNTTAETNQSILATILNYNPKTTYILDIETANDMMILDYTAIDSLGHFNFYIEKAGKHLGSFKKINPNTGEKEFLQTVILNITPEKIGFVITSIEVKSFNPMKEDHKAWDNGMGNYLPDVYVNLTINDKPTFHTAILYDRKFNEPFSYGLKKGWKIGTNKIYSPKDIIKIILWDNDSVTDHDFMGGTQFTRGSISTRFPKNKTSMNFEDKKRNLKMVFNYKWMSIEELKTDM